MWPLPGHTVLRGRPSRVSKIDVETRRSCLVRSFPVYSPVFAEYHLGATAVLCRAATTARPARAALALAASALAQPPARACASGRQSWS